MHTRSQVHIHAQPNRFMFVNKYITPTQGKKAYIPPHIEFEDVEWDECMKNTSVGGEVEDQGGQTPGGGWNPFSLRGAFEYEFEETSTELQDNNDDFLINE